MMSENVSISSVPLSTEEALATIEEIFASCGGEAYLGEGVTMAEHMLQAAQLGEEAEADEAVIVAALLHDIGHFTGALGRFTMEDHFDRRHEEAGAAALASFFPDIVRDCVRWHVAAKRYLCATDKDYWNCLSAASRHSLKLQGGPMSAAEVEAFAAEPHLDAILAVRRWDDAGKVPGRSTPDFQQYVPMLRRVIEKAAGSRA